MVEEEQAMIVTEAEARKAWCPQGRRTPRTPLPPHSAAATATQLNPSVNRTWDDAPWTRCLASGCMAWRWLDYDEPHSAKEERRGYCGLAGQPAPAWEETLRVARGRLKTPV